MTRWRILRSLAVAAVLAGCGSGASGSGSTSANTSPIVIGVSVSLTGDFSSDGKFVQQGYQLWADHVNAAGGILGRQVTFKFVDDASSTDQVKTNYTNLITVDKVDFTFGGFSSKLTIPASQVTDRYNYAFPEPAGGGPTVFDRGSPYIFFVQPARLDDAFGVYVKWVLSLPADQRPKSVAYATLDDPFAQPQTDNARKQLEAAGIPTAFSTVYPTEPSSWDPIASQIVHSNADAVVLGTLGDDAFTFLQYFKSQHWNPKSIVEASGPDQGSVFSDKLGGSTEGMMVPLAWFPGAKSNGNDVFVSEYIKKFGGKPEDISGDAAEAYSVGQVVAEAATKAGTLDNKAVARQLHNGTWDTVQGPIAWDSVGRPQGTNFLIQWQQGKTVPVYPASAATAPPEYPKPAWS
jgi:branched-chain amino acid transport system substrate-binding protein